MKLFNLNHIALVPYVTCNLHCSYCVTTNRSLTLSRWNVTHTKVAKFLATLPPKAIMVSGGEPFIWKGWPDFLVPHHTWYFLTNATAVFEWLRGVRSNVKLIIAAYHHTEVGLERFISQIKKLQDMGYPVFTKIVYDGDSVHLDNMTQIYHAGIPGSLSPKLGAKLTPDQIAAAMPFCQSEMYRARFLPPPFGSVRAHTRCIAGTSKSFEIDGCQLSRCSHVSMFMLTRWLHTVQYPSLAHAPQPCSRDYCACEWHTFGELDTRPNENERWQRFVTTGVWQ